MQNFNNQNNQSELDGQDNNEVTQDGNGQSRYIGQPCSINEDCKKSSWCCSGGKCVPGSTCYQGSKLIDDFCENNYECLSRCCGRDQKQCRKFNTCARTCQQNADCTLGCCSFGYCSSLNVCQGRKAQGDNCNRNSECQSRFCSIDDSNDAKDSDKGPDDKKSLFGASSFPVSLFRKDAPVSLSGEPQNGVCIDDQADKPLDCQTIIAVFIVIFAIVLIIISVICICCQCLNQQRRERYNQPERQGSRIGSNNIQDGSGPYDQNSTSSRGSGRNSSNYSSGGGPRRRDGGSRQGRSRSRGGRATQENHSFSSRNSDSRSKRSKASSLMEENLTQLESSQHGVVNLQNNSQGTFSIGSGSNDFKLFESEPTNKDIQFVPRNSNPNKVFNSFAETQKKQKSLFEKQLHHQKISKIERVDEPDSFGVTN